MIRYERLLRGSRAFRLFEGDFRRNALHHCYLISAPDRALLTEFAKLCACLLYCERGGTGAPCLQCAGCLRYENFSGANVFVYPKGDRMKKDDVEDLLANVQYKAFEHGRKIGIIRDAHRMDASAQNKLLKTLEEPPENVLFLLLAENDEKLLPTVRSRTRRLSLEPFPTAEIGAELRREGGTDEARIRMACALSGGYPGAAESFLKDPGAERVWKFCTDLLRGLRTPADFVKYSVRFDEIRDRFESFLDVL